MDPIPIKKLNGLEAFMQNGVPVGLTLSDFWAWAFSDCINNTTRGILAEFLVAAALGIDLGKPRDAWSKYDLEYRGKGIEVKSASYHQRWYQAKESTISFKVPPRLGWDAETNKQDTVPKRHAFIYVLCHLAEQERLRVDPLDTDQWKFWVVPTSFFDGRIRSQHSITLASLIKEVKEGQGPIAFGQIREQVDKLIPEAKTGDAVLTADAAHPVDAAVFIPEVRQLREMTASHTLTDDELDAMIDEGRP